MSKLKPQKIDFNQIGKYLAGAERKLSAAEKVLSIDEEAAYQIAYEAMLKASLGFLLSFGVRPRSQPGHHVVVIEFAGEKLGAAHQGLADVFDRMRRKRNQALYEAAAIISKQEATQAVAAAKEWISAIRAEIQKRKAGA
jgi:uncharacterized protein (UPF0332 family)